MIRLPQECRLRYNLKDMKQSTKNLLRWIAVLPGAIIGGFLATFPLHWVLYFTLANGETISGVNISPIEYALYPFVIAVTFVLIGYKIAPNHKFKTSIVLACLWIASLIGLFLFMRGQAQFEIRTAGSLFGPLLGVAVSYFSKKSEAEQRVENKAGDLIIKAGDGGPGGRGGDVHVGPGIYKAGDAIQKK